MVFWGSLLALAAFCYGLCTQMPERSKQRIIAYFDSAVLIVLAGMRSGIGDTGYYLLWFNRYKSVPVTSLVGAGIKEAGFAVFMAMVGKITQSPQIYLLIVAGICIGGTFYVICHHSRDIGLSLFLFLAAGFFIGMMNGIRQYLVVTMLFLLIHCLLENKPVPYIAAAILLSWVHTSALVMIPVFFVVQQPVWKRSTILMLAVVLVAVIGMPAFFSWLGSLLETSTYAVYADALINETGEGANILRVFVMMIPVGLSFVGRKYFSEDDREYKVYSNMVLLNAICYVFAVQNWFFARLGMYLGIYLLLFYPYVLPRMFKGENLKLAKSMMIILYGIYFYFEIRNTPYMSYYLNINADLIGPLTRSIY